MTDVPSVSPPKFYAYLQNPKKMLCRGVRAGYISFEICFESF